MRPLAIASLLLLTLPLRAQELPDAAMITKQVQEAALAGIASKAGLSR